MPLPVPLSGDDIVAVLPSAAVTLTPAGPTTGIEVTTTAVVTLSPQGIDSFGLFQSVTRQAPTAAVTLTPQAPGTAVLGPAATQPTAAVTLAPQAPTVSQPAIAEPVGAALTLEPQAPSASLSSQVADPASAVVTLSPQAAAASAGGDVVVEIGGAVVTLSPVLPPPTLGGPRPAGMFDPFIAGREDDFVLPATPGTMPVLLVPDVEPLSAGEPPHPPVLIARVDAGYETVRRRVRSGQPWARRRVTKHRARYRLRWQGLTDDEWAELRTFFRDEVGGRRLGFNVRIDGDDVGELRTLRMLELVRHQHVADGVSDIAEAVAEELF